VNKFNNWHVDWAKLIDSYKYGRNIVTVVYWPKEKTLNVTHDKTMRHRAFRVKTEKLSLVREEMKRFVHHQDSDSPFVYVFFVEGLDVVGFLRTSSELFPVDT
jgi:hypothetical protein